MAKKIYKETISNSNGNANIDFHGESGEIIGNQYLQIFIEKVFPDGSNVYDPRVDLSDVTFSIKDQDGNENDPITGLPYDTFEITANDTFKLKDGITLLNITSMKFKDMIVIRRNSGSGGSGDSADQFALESLVIDGSNNQVISNAELFEPIPDSYKLASNERLTKRRSYELPVEDDLPNGLNSNYQLAWRIRDYAATEIQLKEFKFIIEISWFDPTKEGGQ